jgi:hypothetical protein
MTLKTFLFLLSLVLLVFLFINNTFQIDIAATKNNGLTSIKKQEVDQMQNIDSVKNYTKYNLDIIRQNARTNSTIATKRMWLILALIVIQLLLWTKRILSKTDSKFIET